MATKSDLNADRAIIEEARERLKRGLEWEDLPRKYWREDTRFAEADARNGDQWPDKLYDQRDDQGRPCLTINKIRTHNRIIINEALQNKTAIRVRPVAGEASYDGAKAMQALIRRIENISTANVPYRTAISHQVKGGFGYITLTTDYVSDRTFDQDIFIRGVRDPLCIVLDCDGKDPTGLDSNWGFEFDDILREDFDKKYPKYKNLIGKSTLGADEKWINDKYIRRAMYHRRNGKDDVLITYLNEAKNNERVTTTRNAHPKELIDPVIEQIQKGELDGKLREIVNQAVEWFLIVGDCIVDRGDWAGKYIPIIRVVGEEVVLDGKLDRKGMTRYLIDQQRMLNYNASGQVEFGALQSKSPYVGPARAFEGQPWWKDANKKNYAYLPYNDVDEEATDPSLAKIERPQRAEPPQTAPVYTQGMADAENQMMMASGQYQEKMGASSETISGKAINARERQSDRGNAHFAEHQNDMFRSAGIQLIDLIPKVYDAETIKRVLGEDGTKFAIKINPQAQQAYEELKTAEKDAASIIFNPGLGEYECVSDPGPDYATQRQEAWNAMSLILQQNENLTSVCADLLFKYGDFPGADELMERVRKEIQATKPYLFNEDADPGMMALQQQLQAQVKLNAELTQKLAEMQLRLVGRDQKRDIEAYKGETDRVAKLANAIPELGSREDLIKLITETIRGMRGLDLTDEINEQQIAAE